MLPRCLSYIAIGGFSVGSRSVLVERGDGRGDRSIPGGQSIDIRILSLLYSFSCSSTHPSRKRPRCTCIHLRRMSRLCLSLSPSTSFLHAALPSHPHPPNSLQPHPPSSFNHRGLIFVILSQEGEAQFLCIHYTCICMIYLEGVA